MLVNHWWVYNTAVGEGAPVEDVAKHDGSVARDVELLRLFAIRVPWMNVTKRINTVWLCLCGCACRKSADPTLARSRILATAARLGTMLQNSTPMVSLMLPQCQTSVTATMCTHD